MNAELVKLRNTLHKDFYTNQYYLIRVFFYDSTTFCLNENNNFSRTLSLYIRPPPPYRAMPYQSRFQMQQGYSTTI